MAGSLGRRGFGLETCAERRHRLNCSAYRVRGLQSLFHPVVRAPRISIRERRQRDTKWKQEILVNDPGLKAEACRAICKPDVDQEKEAKPATLD
jgi:hypothetical protein